MGVLARALRFASAFATITDSFNRADSTTTMGNTDTGQTWIADAGTWGITGNKAYPVTGADSDRCSIDAGSTDLTVAATIGPTNVNRFYGVTGRGADANNFYMAMFSSATSYFFKNVAGTYTQLAVQSTSFSGDDQVTFNLNGTAAVIKVAGVANISTTDSSITTGTRAGMRHGWNAGGTDTGAQRYDDFSVTVP